MKRLLHVALGLALLAFVKPYDVGAVDAPHDNPCTTCHIQGSSGYPTNSSGFNNNCLSCHDKTVAPSKVIRVSKAFADGDQNTTSHKWSGPDENLAKGAQHPAPTSALHNVTAYTGNTLACVSCHDPHKNGKPDGYADFLRVDNKKDSLCLDCHRTRNVQRNNTAGSHPVFIGYSTSLRTKAVDFKANVNLPVELNTRLTASGNMVLCSTCHGTHNVANAGNLTTPGVGGGDLLLTNPRGAAVPPGEADKLNLCTNCHANKFNHNAKKTNGDNGQDIQCNDCHGAHVNDVADLDHGINQKLVRRTLSNGNKVYFANGINYYSANGVCKGCHETLPSSVGDHSNTQGCGTCHSHSNPKGSFSLSADNLTCTSCHGSPPGTTKFGVKDYTHTSNKCADCHSVPSTAMHSNNVIEILTNDNACASCHGYPPVGHVTNGYNAVAGTLPNCSTCHTYTGFNGVTHSNGTVDVASMSCTSCHGNPPQVLTVAKSGHTGQHLNVTNCDMCHGVNAGNNNNHKNGTVDTLKSGAPHFNNVTSGMYPAAYVTTTSTCANCHNANANNATIRGEWAASGHANTTALPWIDYDFKTRSGCVQCHTTTGFIAYSTAKVTAAWGTASDKTKEVLTCVGCHSDVANGTVRTVTPVKPFDVETTYQNVDMGTSNICADCHSGRNNGATIQAKVAANANFANLSFISPHYLSAAGTLQGKTGYNFPGRSYTGFNDNSHSKIGVENANTTGTDGPCVTCHMSATDKHSFNPVTTDTNGAITAIKTSVCANCHGTTLPAATLETKRMDFTSALAVLRAALAARTPAIIVTDGYPYVANKNWGTGQNGANLMGATFNLKLFLSEPAAYTHNPEYAKQIIADSIIAAVYGGDLTTGNPDINSALAALVSASTITQAQADSLTVYKAPTSSCTSCHGNPPATTTHVNNNVTATTQCVTCHIWTGPNGATHLNGTVDLKGDIGCDACHGYPPLPTSALATSNANGTFANAKLEDYGNGGGFHASHLLPTLTADQGFAPCLPCHPTGATHNNGNGVVARANVNVFDPADTSFRFDASRPKTYYSLATTCSNVSCHFKSSPAWNQ
ncbi:MAG: cytochrome c3 family protein [Desulfuromonadales bacterium]